MYGTCGRIDNKADFDFDFELMFVRHVTNKHTTLKHLLYIVYCFIHYSLKNSRQYALCTGQ